jgi:hypothetical protein
MLRSIVVYLILALASSPALAAYCATACATDSINITVLVDNFCSPLSSHDNQSSETPAQSESSKEDLPCAMGAGCCHLFQATPATVSKEHVALDEVKSRFHRYTPSEKSAVLSPPLKPPA